MSTLSHWVAFNSSTGPANSPWLTQIIVAGDTVYLSGVVGKADDGSCVLGGVGAQTTRAIELIAQRLSILELDLTNVTNVLVHLTSMKKDFSEMNEAYMRAFTNNKGIPFPTRTCVGAELSGLFNVELTVTARARTSLARNIEP